MFRTTRDFFSSHPTTLIIPFRVELPGANRVLYGLPHVTLLILVLIPLAIWSSFWKIIGLWFSARNSDKGWFVLFIFVNLAGILEIYYLHSKKNWPFNPKT
jgi:hypothetical protein